MSEKHNPEQSNSTPSEDHSNPIPPPHPDNSTPIPVSSPSPPQPQPGTYIIQIPKDQIYRVPPPENALRYKHLTKQNKSTTRRRCCRRCCFSFLIILFLLLISAVVFYLIVKPESPTYTLQSLTVNSLNLTTSSPISPRMNLSLSIGNPNDKISIHYLDSTSVDVFYQGVSLCSGVLPRFHQPRNNVTVVNAVVKAENPIELTNEVRERLRAEEKAGRVRVDVEVRAAVKFQVGRVKSWRFVMKVNCGVTVDKLNSSQSKILEKDCEYRVGV